MSINNQKKTNIDDLSTLSSVYIEQGYRDQALTETNISCSHHLICIVSTI